MAENLDPNRKLKKGVWVKHSEIVAMDAGKKTIYPAGAGVYMGFDDKVGQHMVDLVNWDTGETYGVSWLNDNQFSMIVSYDDIPPVRRPK